MADTRIGGVHFEALQRQLEAVSTLTEKLLRIDAERSEQIIALTASQAELADELRALREQVEAPPGQWRM